jgi:hypothetical protein
LMGHRVPLELLAELAKPMASRPSAH